ncbi:MAG: hypothetical protein NZM38_10050 [Cytophagales bacterium]|nr:hypothetical protein [Cytophagales bacterium]MDW8385097.1 hypothetical protein [Flammeovirgaceae bacterium]
MKKELIILALSFPLWLIKMLPGENFFLTADTQERLLGRESYDYRFQYMNTISALNAVWEYITFQENAIGDSAKTAELAYQLVKDRFAFGEGYARYTLKENWLIYLMGKYIWSDFSAKVIPDEIIKHPHAACSQQSIVLLTLLRSKGYPVRKIGFKYGHFALEVYYDEKWHYIDVTYEPVWDFPKCSFEELCENNMEKLVSIYSECWPPEETRAKYQKGYWYGTPDEVIAWKMVLLHRVTQLISDYLVYVLLLIVVFQWIRKKIIPFIKVSPKISVKHISQLVCIGFLLCL